MAVIELLFYNCKTDILKRVANQFMMAIVNLRSDDFKITSRIRSFSNLPTKRLRNDTKHKLWKVVATKGCNVYSIWRCKTIPTYEWNVHNENQLLSSPNQVL